MLLSCAVLQNMRQVRGKRPLGPAVQQPLPPPRAARPQASQACTATALPAGQDTQPDLFFMASTM